MDKRKLWSKKEKVMNNKFSEKDLLQHQMSVVNMANQLTNTTAKKWQNMIDIEMKKWEDRVVIQKHFKLIETKKNEGDKIFYLQKERDLI